MIGASRSLALGALTLSAGLHFGAVAWFAPDSQQAELAGGAPTSFGKLGNSFRDVASGTLTPQETEEIQEPEQPPVSANLSTDDLLPSLEPGRSPSQKTQSVMRAEPTMSALSGLKPAADATVTPSVAASAVPVLPRAIEASPITPEAQTPLTTLAALPSDDDAAPLLSNRPKLRPKSIEAKAPTQPKTKPRKLPRQTASRQGTQAPAEVQGSNDGQQAATQANTVKQTAQTSTRAGNAAASNYKGKVHRKLTRVRKRTVGKTGKATVLFQIAANGSLSSVSVARSSGIAEVDREAVNHVKRAAPFPKPPAGADRVFRVPILIN